MNNSYLLLGSNMGDSNHQLKKAIQLIEQKIGKVTRKSGLYQTAAWGNTNQPDFLNQVIIVKTKLSAPDLLECILQIEESLGRIRTIKNAPRVIDIDILFFNKDIISEKNLAVPHPEIANRKFVLIPMNELSPNFKHPISKKSMHQLLLACIDKLNVKKVLTA